MFVSYKQFAIREITEALITDSVWKWTEIGVKSVRSLHQIFKLNHIKSHEITWNHLISHVYEIIEIIWIFKLF